MVLQNRVRDINGLAENPMGYRYTIPKVRIFPVKSMLYAGIFARFDRDEQFALLGPRLLLVCGPAWRARDAACPGPIR
jgi:hypothetical protein